MYNAGKNKRDYFLTSNDKEAIRTSCLTPDCDETMISIQIFKDGGDKKLNVIDKDAIARWVNDAINIQTK